MRGKRGLTFAFGCLLSHVPHWPFSCCMRPQPRGGTSPQALACSKSVLYNTWLVTIRSCHGPLRILRPAGRDLEHHARQYTCGFLSLPLNLGQCARGWPSPHVSRDSYVEAVHEPHQHLRSLACEMFRAQVRRVRLSGDLFTVSFPLRTAS